jgi:hypothetical protein
MLNLILNLARTRIMKKTRITVTHKLEKTQHHYMIVNPYKLISSEVDKIRTVMSVDMVFVNGKVL